MPTYPLNRGLVARCSVATALVLLTAAAAAPFGGGLVRATVIGINFQVDGTPDEGFTGKPVTARAFGVEPANWFNMTPGSRFVPVIGSQTVHASHGGPILVSWSAANAWQVNLGLVPGDAEVFWGYLDDGGTGNTVTISGLSSIFSSYVVQTISSTDNGISFLPMALTNGPQVLTYSTSRTSAGALGGVSGASTPLSDNTVMIQGLPKSILFERGSLAGILLADEPIIQSQPQAPASTIHEGDSFSLSVGALGVSLGYQWRKAGANLGGASSATYTKAMATTNDSGSYDVLVTNSYGSLASSNVSISVAPQQGTAVPLANFTAMPATLQLYPRERPSNCARVPIGGTVMVPGYDAIIARVTREGAAYTNVTRALSYDSQAQAAFFFEVPIPAELANYNFRVYLRNALIETLAGSADNVVAGDALVINGQSNAEAYNMFADPANGNQSIFLRSFGTRSPESLIVTNDPTWRLADGDTANGYTSDAARQGKGAVGQWGLKLGRLIVDGCHVPVAIINHAEGGQPISWFQRNESNPDDINSNYGQVLWRLRRAGLAGSVRAILWYQGEAEFDNAAAHQIGFTALHQAWLEEFPGLEKVYVHQVRTGCGVAQTDLQNRQRLFADTLERLAIMSTTGIDGHDGCHFTFVNGYELIGEHIFKLVERDLYGAAAAANVEPPNIRLAWFTTPAHDQLALVMRNAADTLTWQAGAEADFRVDNIANSVLGGSVSSNAILLTLSSAATNGTTITYAGHSGPGPWAKNSSGLGLLCFDHEPILRSLAPPINSHEYQTYVLRDAPLAYYRFGERRGASLAINCGSLGAAADGIYSQTATGARGPGAPTDAGLEYTNLAASFDGAGSHVVLGNPSGLNFTGRITLEAWVRPFVRQSGLADLIAHGVNTADNAEVELRITDNNRYEIGSWDGSAPHNVTFPVPPEDWGNWLHLAGTYDGTNWNLYRNGTLVASSPNAIGAVLVNDAGWAIGGRGWTGGPDRLFTGDLDEVAIYNYALSSAQVVAHYFAGKTGPLLAISTAGGSPFLTWSIGTLQQSDLIASGFSDVRGAQPPYTPPTNMPNKFYRLRLP